MTFLVLLSACAASHAHRFLSEHTEGHVFSKPIGEVWPVAKALLAERGFLADETGGPYRMQTAALMPDGALPAALSNTNAAIDTGRAGGRHSGAVAPTRSTGEVWRFVVNGSVVDAAHCRVQFVRFTRDSFDAPEALPVFDADLEWALISRVEPERAAAIRQDAQAAEVTLPP